MAANKAILAGAIASLWPSRSTPLSSLSSPSTFLYKEPQTTISLQEKTQENKNFLLSSLCVSLPFPLSVTVVRVEVQQNEKTKIKNCFDFRPLTVVTRENLISLVMGFLHKLWDETLAGPMLDTGLGKLRKYNSFPVRSSPPVNASSANSNGEMNVTRSITIIRTNSSNLRNLSVDPGSAPESPAPPSTPGTPLTRMLYHLSA